MMDETILPSVVGSAFECLKALLGRLGSAPPQVLLLEGGSEEERFDMARYWGACCNCPQRGAHHPPCLACPVCRQIAAGEFLDMFVYDGRISNAEDRDNPGPVRAFTVDNTRQLKHRLRDAPHGNGCRLVLIMGIDKSRFGAANAILKLLEEPAPNTVFVLLASQREQLLPTLVSRSCCLTLPCQDTGVQAADISAWEAKLAVFLQEGQGFLEDVVSRGAVDARLAERLVLACQKALSAALAGAVVPDEPLQAVFAGFDAHGLVVCSQWLIEAQEALRRSVTPPRVLEALAARLFVLRGGYVYFQRLPYLAAMASVRSASLSTTASISS
ncbi:DNA polymerase III subunit delta' [Candidatus Desulfovibrio trichonymphae]|nr:DNA polymerase III subunit delta' [Candidatus Desulfovibrio trichonymphae]